MDTTSVIQVLQELGGEGGFLFGVLWDAACAGFRLVPWAIADPWADGLCCMVLPWACELRACLQQLIPTLP